MEADLKPFEIKLSIVIVSIIILFVSFGGTYVILKKGVGNISDYFYELGHGFFSTNRSFKGYFNDGGELSSGRYGFSFEFPEKWGMITVVNEDFFDERIEGVLDTFYWQSEKDEDRFFYLLVGDAIFLDRGEVESRGRKFLGESPSFVYYFMSTEVPRDCLKRALVDLSSGDIKRCDRLNLIYQDEIQKTILYTFEILK
jgi:hypothetical protein